MGDCPRLFAYNNIGMLQYVVSYDGWLSKMSVLMLQYCVVKWMTARCHGIRVWFCIMSRDGLQDLCAYDTVLCLEMSDCKILVLMIQYCVSRWVNARQSFILQHNTVTWELTSLTVTHRKIQHTVTYQCYYKQRAFDSRPSYIIVICTCILQYGCL
jgi:hypothetical protein